ncbi:glycosyltransferase 87 family protein [Solirubrum puertoriconensis]|uniref:glycosyltransferase 87 family protein n=1 Tax=Solirubrum puertoriconensis TaxID=1751427 RepID=UPI0013656924|nr:glycosyltransferase 87 family protein [Solirubrum puertoriconensis]
MRTWLQSGAVIVLCLALGALAYATPRQHTAQLLLLFGAATVAYAGLLHGRLPLRAGLLLAVLLRLLWLPVLPNLSDDYHRFRWDGALLVAGENPYQHRPHEYRAGGGMLANPPGITRELYGKLNSPRYYSVYPPISQAVFGAAVWLFPSSEFGQVVAMRMVLLLAEAATAVLLCLLLRRWQIPTSNCIVYLLHPLVITELAGNLHFEALVITGVLLVLWLLVKGRWGLAAAALGLAAATKLTPLLLLPLLIKRLGWAHAFGFGSVVALVLGLSFAPFASAVLVSNISRSLDLYFHSFEFNASVYYLLRTIGYWLSGYNQIALLGTWLAAAAFLGILAIAATETTPRLATLPKTFLLVLTLYYAFATTVHPWYLAPLVALSCFTTWRYPAAWAGAAVLSYATYRTAAYHEHLGLVALEYAVVLLFAWLDWHRSRRCGTTNHLAHQCCQ